MSLFDEKLIKLAKRSNAEMMNSVDAFAQGFIMGRAYQKELQVQIYNSALRDTYSSDTIKYTGDNFWENLITKLEKELDVMKSKYEPYEGEL